MIVGPEHALYSKGLVAKDLHWISGEPPGQEFEAEAQIRYRSLAVPAKVRLIGKEARVEFAQAQRAVTPGQAVVFYWGEEVLGGGVIALSGDFAVML